MKNSIANKCKSRINDSVTNYPINVQSFQIQYISGTRKTSYNLYNCHMLVKSTSVSCAWKRDNVMCPLNN